MTAYAEFSALSNFSFLRGASHPDELVFQAARLGQSAIAIADINSFAGIVRGHAAAKKAGFPYIVGARLRFADGTPDLLCYPENRAAYGRLSKMLTRGKMRAGKGKCILTLRDALEAGEGQFFALSPEEDVAGVSSALNELRSAFPERVWLAASRRFRDDDRARLNRLAAMARQAFVPLLATNNVLYHTPARRPLQDILHCIREGVTIDAAGRALEANAERHLKSPREMARLFSDHPAAIEETLRITEKIRFSLDELRYEYPKETCGDSASPQEELERLAWLGAGTRYPSGVPEKVRAAIEHELQLIGELSYAPYFLTVHDIVKYARSIGVLCQGRGSAANSAVCYCLGITSVDPDKVDLLFERFVSAERGEPPDIDVDFEHERREEVIQHIYGKYGRRRAGIAATVITYRARSAVREVGKAFGLSEDIVSNLAGSIWGWSSDGVKEKDARESGIDPNDPLVRQTLTLTRELIGFPRHLSQHTGGFVITDGPLEELIPIGNAAMDDRTFIEWDKDDIDALGILKIDVLGLGMLTCIAKSFSFLRSHYGIEHDLASLPAEERAVYDMLCRGDSIGVFQVESRAQMAMLPRLRPRNFYDLVIEVAIVRPGPIQGDMVHPYLRRRDGEEKVVYPSKDLEDVLGKTLGVPLFQEQAMKIAIVAGGFTPSEADSLRRAMATFRRSGAIHSFHDKLINGMVERGYDAEFAERCFKQIEGFGEYGFPESHAASFALLVYVSSWLKCHYPDVFCAALLNSLPMGFYAPAQIVRDAREHGVEVRHVDVNHSDWDSTLEPAPLGGVAALHQSMQAEIRTSHAVRLGFREIKGVRRDEADKIVACRSRSYDSLRELWLKTGISRAALERLADADAFRSIGLDRRDALWAVRGLDPVKGDDFLPLFARESDIQREAEAKLPSMPLGEHVAYDYKTIRLSLKAHPVSFARARLSALKFDRAADLRGRPHGARIGVAGLVTIRQRPGSAKGVVFVTLEDETANANVIVWPKLFERFRRVVIGARFLGVYGQMQRQGDVIHLIAERLVDLTGELSVLGDRHGEMDDGLSRADEIKHGVAEDPRAVKMRRSQRVAGRMSEILPKGRNFH